MLEAAGRRSSGSSCMCGILHSLFSRHRAPEPAQAWELTGGWAEDCLQARSGGLGNSGCHLLGYDIHVGGGVQSGIFVHISRLRRILPKSMWEQSDEIWAAMHWDYHQGRDLKPIGWTMSFSDQTTGNASAHSF